MHVFLIPVGGERYEPYCEIEESDTVDHPVPPRGVIKSFLHRFRQTLKTVEQDRRQAAATPPEGRERRKWTRRMRDAALRWVAAAIAEQRLLWHLRREDDATLFYPADLPEQRAAALLRGSLRRDGDKHRRWLIVDSIGLVLSGLLMLIPGPNVLAYYFIFRVVGHYLSMRGARHGLAAVRWTTTPSDALAELRRAITLAPQLRAQHVHEVATQLQLQHLAAFVERVVISSA